MRIRRTTSGTARQRGAALLLALLILTLVATLAVSMVWQQWRALQVETAERARTQSAWILSGALDWARLILREDAKESGGTDHLGEPWAVPLAEARLSSFLAADRDNNAPDSADALDAFLSGSITDAQSRWNLRRLISADGAVVPAELAVLRRLAEAAQLPSGLADELAAAAQRAWGQPSGSDADDTSLVAPQRLSQWQWAGVDPQALARLESWVVILPDPSARLNLNTAPAEVIAAVVEGMSTSSARRLVQDRQRQPLRQLGQGDSLSYFPPSPPTNFDTLTIASQYFVVQGRLRLEGQVLEERSLIRRNNLDIVVLSRERVSSREGP
jgi:general secretion pathway protein K